MNSKQVVLIIFDGWGIAPPSPENAIEKAHKPFFDKLWKEYPHSKFDASGEAVGLPPGNIGSSEIGHMTIGAGTVIDTDQIKLNKLAENDQIDQSPAIKEAFLHTKKNDSVLHLCGQLSNGGVHSHQDHLFALLRAAKKAGIKRVAIHIFTDGRDTAPTSGAKFVEGLEKEIEKIGVGFIATISGRYYAMDRDNRWDRLQLVEEAMFSCIGKKCDLSPTQTLEDLYKSNETDEFIKPLIFEDSKGNTYPVSENDSIIFFNFRPDRARMLSSKLSEKAKNENICFVTLTEYDPKIECLVAYPPTKIETTLSEEISKAGLTQAHIAETEKYAHVTYFFNGGREEKYPKETDILIPSNKDVATYDLAPEMKALEIANAAVSEIEKGTNFIVLNFANPDMVGHTGNFDATVKAIEETDKALQIVVEKAIEKGSICFITSDHGNAEMEIDPQSGEKFTAHTLNQVPAIITDKNIKLATGGGLSDIAPTILSLLKIEKPQKMTGKNLIID